MLLRLGRIVDEPSESSDSLSDSSLEVSFERAKVDGRGTEVGDRLAETADVRKLAFCRESVLDGGRSKTGEEPEWSRFT